MDPLATVLRRIPLFADLPPGGLAKIIADLREERHPQGAAICYEGDEASDFYIVKSGEVEVLVNRRGNQREVVAVNGPSDDLSRTSARPGTEWHGNNDQHSRYHIRYRDRRADHSRIVRFARVHPTQQRLGGIGHVGVAGLWADEPLFSHGRC